MARKRATNTQEIIDAAAHLFTRKGYHNTTIDDIAEQVGISKPTVYQYVESKGWLLEAIFDTVLKRLESGQDHIRSEIEDPAEQLREVIRYYVKSVADLLPYFHIYFGEEPELPPRTQRHFRQAGRRMIDGLTSVLESGARRGQLRDDVDPHVAALLIGGMLTSVYRWYDPKGPLEAEDISHQATRLLEGFLIDGAEPASVGAREASTA